MEKLENLQVASSDTNITGLRKLFDEIEQNLRSKRTKLSFELCTNVYLMYLCEITGAK